MQFIPNVHFRCGTSQLAAVGAFNVFRSQNKSYRLNFTTFVFKFSIHRNNLFTRTNVLFNYWMNTDEKTFLILRSIRFSRAKGINYWYTILYSNSIIFCMVLMLTYYNILIYSLFLIHYINTICIYILLLLISNLNNDLNQTFRYKMLKDNYKFKNSHRLMKVIVILTRV